jgi:hypothetical protein
MSLGALSSAWKAFRHQRADERARRDARRRYIVRRVDLPAIDAVMGQYLVTSERGLFAIHGGRMFQLFAGDTFGLAVRGDDIFVASSTNLGSRVVRTTLEGGLVEGTSVLCEEIYAVKASKHSRIHQLGMVGDVLAVCQTSTNSIVLLDPSTGAVRREIHPMVDAVGTPVTVDHNHLNSVSQCGQVILFCLYRAGSGSMLGVLHGDRVKGYAVRNVGAHDVHVAGRTIYYSDTFGETYTRPGVENGFLMIDDRRFDEAFFGGARGYAIRGFAQAGDELLIGHSHKGPRRTRFKGRGGLLRCVRGAVVEDIALPCSQVYDVVQLSGRHFDVPPAVTTWDDVTALFESVFGKPIYEIAL